MDASMKAALAAGLMVITGQAAHAQSFGSVTRGAERPPEQEQQRQQQQRQDRQSGWRTTDGNSRSGQRFDNNVDQNSRNWSQPRQSPNGYDQYQNFDPNEVYLPTQVSPRPVSCQVNTYGIRNPGYMAAVTVADANSCRPIVISSGARDFIQINDYGYQGRGVHQYQISLRGGQVTAVTIDGRVQLPPQFGEALLDRPLGGVQLARTSMDGPQTPQVKSIRQWVGLGY